MSQTGFLCGRTGMVSRCGSAWQWCPADNKFNRENAAMMELKTIVPIVARAENRLDIVNQIVKEIQAHYEAALEARKTSNQRGLTMAQGILRHCHDAEVLRKLAFINSKEQKPQGGTPTKVYSMLCDEIAKASSYDATYLRNCCIEYLAGVNKVRVKKGLDPVTCEKKTGAFASGAVGAFEVPISEILALVDTPVKAPKVDNLFTHDEDAGPETNEDAAHKAEAFARKLEQFCIIKKPDGASVFSIRNFNVIVQKLSPVVQRAGYAIVRNKNSKGAKFNEKE
jgi:hypothetical protein